MDPARQAPAPADGESYGVQWKTIGSLLGVFWVSWIFTYALAEPASRWQVRAWASLCSAGWIFFGAMMGMRLLRGFVSRRHLSSNATFVVVWVIAFVAWWVVTHRP
jgi:hypothetical protein